MPVDVRQGCGFQCVVVARVPVVDAPPYVSVCMCVPVCVLRGSCALGVDVFGCTVVSVVSRLLSWCLVVVAQVASTAGYALSQIVEANRELSLLVAGTVQQMVLRPKTSPRGKYYAVVFLNQLVLSKATSELANQLMRIYFALFEASVEVWPLSLCAVRVPLSVGRRPWLPPS